MDVRKGILWMNFSFSWKLGDSSSPQSVLKHGVNDEQCKGRSVYLLNCFPDSQMRGNFRSKILED